LEKLDNGVYIVKLDTTNSNIINQANKIGYYTKNTWQPERSDQEKINNTKDGKLAEKSVEKVLEELGINYCSYDSFRTDNFHKHAPFDGLIYSNYSQLRKYISEINLEVQKGKNGKVSSNLLDKMIKNKVYPVEIKSTKIARRHTDGIPEHCSREDAFLIKSNNIIKKDDFLTYPYFIRSSDQEFVDLNWYYEFVRNSWYSNIYVREKLPKDFTLDELIAFERDQQSFFHIRVYQENDIFYVLCFIDRNNFFNSHKLVIKKLFQEGKSEKAVYFTKSLTFGSSLDEIMNYI
jgi:hypothetical protein